MKDDMKAWLDTYGPGKEKSVFEARTIPDHNPEDVRSEDELPPLEDAPDGSEIFPECALEPSIHVVKMVENFLQKNQAAAEAGEDTSDSADEDDDDGLQPLKENPDDVTDAEVVAATERSTTAAPDSSSTAATRGKEPHGETKPMKSEGNREKLRLIGEYLTKRKDAAANTVSGDDDMILDVGPEDEDSDDGGMPPGPASMQSPSTQEEAFAMSRTLQKDHESQHGAKPPTIAAHDNENLPTDSMD